MQPIPNPPEDKPAFRSVPDILVKFLERVEGESNAAYRDLGGVWTAGVGSTTGVTSSTWWDQAVIDQHLVADLQTAVQRLYWAIGPDAIAHLNDYQYAALLSFVFNEGERASWHVWSDIRAGDLSLVPTELRRFDYIRGVRSDAMDNRRAAEIALWNGEDPLCQTYPLKPVDAAKAAQLKA